MVGARKGHGRHQAGQQDEHHPLQAGRHHGSPFAEFDFPFPQPPVHARRQQADGVERKQLHKMPTPNMNLSTGCIQTGYYHKFRHPVILPFLLSKGGCILTTKSSKSGFPDPPKAFTKVLLWQKKVRKPFPKVLP